MRIGPWYTTKTKDLYEEGVYFGPHDALQKGIVSAAIRPSVERTYFSGRLHD